VVLMTLAGGSLRGGKWCCGGKENNHFGSLEKKFWLSVFIIFLIIPFQQ